MIVPSRFLPLLLAAGFVVGSAVAGPPERYKLYAKPDPECPGGITARVIKPAAPIKQVLAIPPDAPEKVYMGTIDESDKQSFGFRWLPMRKYDLIVIYEKDFYEGLQLHRGESTLTDEDKKKIETTVRKSEPFFTQKVIHRVEGETGRGNLSRCICTFMRDKPSDLLWEAYEGEYKRHDFRRTYKLLILKDVGPGWQVERARDLYPCWVEPKFFLPAHHFTRKLSRVRVADSIKDLGEIDLTE